MKSILQNIKKIIAILNKANDPNIMQYASSLSYHTMLAIIPILLVSLSIFTNMPSFKEYFDKIKSFIMSSLLPSHQDIIAQYIETFLQNTIKMGVMGVVVVLFVAIMFFKDYENIINKVMHAKKRSFWQSLAIYWTLITLAPIGLVASFYMSSVIQNFLDSSGYTNWINFLAIFPYLVIWALLFTVYMISSSNQISYKAGLLSSCASSLVWYTTKTLFVYYVTYNKTYISIYGSFSVVLFFFIWIYLSWIIFLYGIRLCYILNTYFLNKKEKITNTNNGNA